MPGLRSTTRRSACCSGSTWATRPGTDPEGMGPKCRSIFFNVSSVFKSQKGEPSVRTVRIDCDKPYTAGQTCASVGGKAPGQGAFDLTVESLTNVFDPTVGVQRGYWSKNFRIGLPFSNSAHYENPEVDRLLEAAAVENDPVKRKQMFKKN